ncbi:S8 family peptidase [Alteromonas facilis]|uniref:S8 family peptidase n=1 Tax=Alteromonas facilis TaxID=2048004 RepID=UPI000C290338|nr:S8 family peptidase [Alteromonas facilis]
MIHFKHSIFTAIFFLTLVSVPGHSSAGNYRNLDLVSSQDPSNEIDRLLKSEQNKRQLEQNSYATNDVPESCVPTNLPSAPTSDIYTLESDWFGDEFRLEFWREPCVSDNDSSVVLVRATPISGDPFICGAGFDVEQGGTSYNSVKLQESINSPSFCESLIEEKTLILNQWSILDNFDDQSEFTVIFNGFNNSDSVVIPANSVTPSFPLTAYNVPNSASGDQITLHIINSGNSSAQVIGTLIHQDGYTLGTTDSVVVEELAPGARREITASDLEVIFGTDTWSKRSRVELLTTSPSVDLLATVRTPNGTTTNLTCTNPYYAHNIPSSVNVDQAFIRVSNVTDETIEVRGTLYHQDGYVLGNEDSVLFSALAPKSTQVITAASLESLTGSNTWTKRARLEITSDTSQIAIMGLIRTSDTLTNMSCSSSSSVPNIPSKENSDKPFVRVTNTSDAPLELNAELLHQDGYNLSDSIVIDTIDAKETLVYSADSLAEVFGVDTWSKRARFNIVGQTSRLSILNLIRSPSDILTNMSCTNDGSAYYIPNTSSVDQAFIRISNRSSNPVVLTGTLYDQNGNVLGEPGFVIDQQLEANGTTVMSSSLLEQYSGSGSWTGLARLEIDTPRSSIELLNLLRNENGTLTNLSCSVKKFGLSKVSGVITSQASLYQDSDTNNPDAVSIFNGTFADAQYVNSPFVIQGYANVAGAGEEGASFDNGDLYDVYYSNLLQGQSLKLEVSESPSNYENDLDLYLYDQNGTLVDSSLSANTIESLIVPSSGIYFIVVNAYSGASNYFLTVSQQMAQTQDRLLRLSHDFVTGDIIAKQKAKETIQSLGVSNTFDVVTGIEQKSKAILNNVGLYSVGSDASSIQQTLGSLNQSVTPSKIALTPLLGEISDQNHAKLNTLLAIKEMQKRSDIEWAEPNYILKAYSATNDPLSQYQWHYSQINLSNAWNVTTGSNDLIVAVVDSGVLLNHPDLNSNIIQGYDFVSNPFKSLDGDGYDADPTDPGENPNGPSSFHGTHVAGTIAASTNNSIGVAGVSWNTSIMPVRVLGRDGFGDLWDILNGVKYSAGLQNDTGMLPSQKADIINLSLGGYQYSYYAELTYQLVRQSGTIIVAAAGNENTIAPSFPASYPGVISVSATNKQLDKASYSDYGPYVDISAPGGETEYSIYDGVYSTVGNDSSGTVTPDYDFMPGTSMASPHVAGVIALMKSVYPDLTPEQVDALIASGEITRDLGASGRDDNFGYGLIDALRAVNAAQELNGNDPGTNPALAVISVQSIDFGVGVNSYDIEIWNGGDGELTVNNVLENASWLYIQEENVSDDRLGSYKLTVDRSNLSPGIYVEEVTFETSSNNLSLLVYLTVPIKEVNRDPGLHYILLIDANTFETAAYVRAITQDGQYQFLFESIPKGDYYILAGTDSDNDFFVCDKGETCGGFPSRERLSVISVDRDIQGLNFTTGADISVSQTNFVDPNQIKIYSRSLPRN